MRARAPACVRACTRVCVVARLRGPAAEPAAAARAQAAEDLDQRALFFGVVRRFHRLYPALLTRIKPSRGPCCPWGGNKQK